MISIFPYWRFKRIISGITVFQSRLHHFIPFQRDSVKVLIGMKDVFWNSALHQIISCFKISMSAKLHHNLEFIPRHWQNRIFISSNLTFLYETGSNHLKISVVTTHVWKKVPCTFGICFIWCAFKQLHNVLNYIQSRFPFFFFHSILKRQKKIQYSVFHCESSGIKKDLKFFTKAFDLRYLLEQSICIYVKYV